MAFLCAKLTPRYPRIISFNGSKRIFSRSLVGESYEADIKNKILAASLPFVNELGWSKEAIAAGAESVGYPTTIHGMFPNGGANLIDFFSNSSNADLRMFMEKGETPKSRPEAVQFIRQSIQHRISLIIPYKKRWPQALALMSAPQNLPMAVKCTQTLADDISFYAGDRSVDFNWYIRRLGIGTIYKATELYFIQDSSADNAETWLFLKNRLEEVAQAYNVIDSVGIDTKQTGNFLISLFITGRNLLGLQWQK